MGRELARLERLDYDPELLYIAALLHDIGLYKAYSHRKEEDHARRSARVAEQLLRDANFPEKKVQTVLDAIEHHPPGASIGGTVEAALLKDAVVLDYLGAVGVARVLAMVGLEEDVPDLAAAVRHSESLHESMPTYLVLESSKHMARDRSREKDLYMESLRDATVDMKLL